MSQLQFYQAEVQGLIRDTSALFIPVRTLNSYINMGRREVAYRTGCIRRLITGQAPFGTGAQPGHAIPGAIVPGMLPGSYPNNAPSPGGGPVGASTPANTFMAIPGVERYDYDYANQYLTRQFSGLSGILDVIDVAVSWGSNRPAMEYMTWEQLQALARSYNTGVTSYPFKWSVYDEGSNGQVWLFPVPSFQCEMEWDCFCYPAPLIDNTSPDAIPEPFNSAVKWYATAMCYLSSQRFGEGQFMMGMFDDSVGVRRVAVDRGKTPSMYDSWPN